MRLLLSLQKRIVCVNLYLILGRKLVLFLKIQRSAEDYLETMLMMQEKHGFIRSVDVATHLNVTKPSVSYAAKHLKNDGYITMDRYGRIELTEKGFSIAKRMYDRHKLLTEFLIRLGVDEETAKEDACKIEHDISEQTFNMICKYACSHSPVNQASE